MLKNKNESVQTMPLNEWKVAQMQNGLPGILHVIPNLATDWKMVIHYIFISLLEMFQFFLPDAQQQAGKSLTFNFLKG